MEVIANLQKTMETLNAKLNTEGSDTSVTTNSYRKRIKTRQSPQKQKLRNRHSSSSNSGSDQEMAKPPDPTTANHTKTNTHQKQDDKATMDADESKLYGGIEDNNISETMAQEYSADHSSTETSSQMAHSNDDL